MTKEEIKCVYSANGITTMSTKQYNNYIEIINNLKKENQQLKKQKDDVVEAIKGILEINNNYSIEKLVPFYSRKWVEDTQSDLLGKLGEIDE